MTLPTLNHLLLTARNTTPFACSNFIAIMCMKQLFVIFIATYSCVLHSELKAYLSNIDSLDWVPLSDSMAMVMKSSQAIIVSANKFWYIHWTTTEHFLFVGSFLDRFYRFFDTKMNYAANKIMFVLGGFFGC